MSVDITRALSVYVHFIVKWVLKFSLDRINQVRLYTRPLLVGLSEA